jgi:uncharacterized protein (TIGR03435 family)
MRHAMALVAALAACIAYSGVAIGQSNAEPALEVATVRPNPPHDVCDSVWSKPGIGSFSAHCVKLPFLIHMAFGIDESQIENQEKWMDSETFDVEVKPSGNIFLTREQLEPVLQQLLKDRFHLVMHREIVTRKGYALVCARKGPKLRQSKSDKPPGFRVYVGPGRLEGLNWSMSYLASLLQNPAGLPVVDKTRLKGAYDINLQFAPGLEQESSLPSLFTALRESLGLELRSEIVAVPVLAIDHIDKTPTAN